MEGTWVALLSAFIGALVGGGATAGTAFWQVRRQHHLDQADAAAARRQQRLDKAAQVSVWVGRTGSRLHVLNASGAAVHFVRVEATLMVGTKIAASTDIEVGIVPPTADATSLRLRGVWSQAYAAAQASDDPGQVFTLTEATWTDGLGDHWRLGTDGTVALEATAEDFDAQILSAVEDDA